MTTGDPALTRLVAEVKDAAREVYAHLQAGHSEDTYRLAMLAELRLRDIDGKRLVCVQEQSADVLYKGNYVGRRQIDIVVNGLLAVELKATGTGEPTRDHMGQARMEHQTAKLATMLINFCSGAELDKEAGEEVTEGVMVSWIGDGPEGG